MSAFSFLQSVDVSSLIVAFLSAIISIAGALYLTHRKINAELRYRRIELTRVYSETILAKRLQVYEGLWYILSHNLKIIHGASSKNRSNGDAQAIDLTKIFDDLSAWDSRNALFLSKNSGLLMHRARTQVAGMIALSQGTDTNIEKQEWKKLMANFAELEISLKTDIGIFEIDDFEARKSISGYYELQNPSAKSA